MRIAQIAPLYESVPPKAYGGTERVVSYLTEMLVEMGHEVTLFASGDSSTTARLSPQTPFALRLRTVYHGLPEDLYSLNRTPDSYLAFIGRISPEKRVDLAIEIAEGAGIPLKIAAKIDKADSEYFRDVIRPLLDRPLIEYIGEIGEDEKGEFIGKAMALLAPIDWLEPFGLVFIEAMACGTPVITRPRGSVPELIEHG